MATAIVAGVVAVIAIAGSIYEADVARKTQHEQEDTAKEVARQQQEQAEELAKIQATRDKTVQQQSEEIGKIQLGESEAERTKRKRGKQALKIESERATIGQDQPIATGATTPAPRVTGVQL
jgi:peptidoglycan hydrolase CwlO-like protein